MKAGTGETIPQLIHTAKALRRTRRMQQQFMLMWALDQAKKDVWNRGDFDSKTDDDFADPHNHDWRILYRGSVLDD